MAGGACKTFQETVTIVTQSPNSVRHHLQVTHSNGMIGFFAEIRLKSGTGGAGRTEALSKTSLDPGVIGAMLWASVFVGGALVSTVWFCQRRHAEDGTLAS